MTHTLILTGASRGIGAAIARIYLEQSPGHNLVAVARSQKPLDELKAAYGERVATLVADIADASTAAKTVGLALDTFGAIDAIVANAGVLEPVEHVEKADFAQWKRLFDINFFSVAQLAQEAIPHLKATGGKFIVVSSGASTGARPGWGAYGSSKAAVNLLVSTIHVENPGLQTVSIAPGVVATDMQRDIREKFGKGMTEESLQRFLDLHKNGQLLAPEVPATVYANLATGEWPEGINGKYYRFDDKVFAKFSV